MKKLFEDWRRHLNEEEIEEGLDQLTPENFGIALAAFEKFMQEPAVLTALLGGGLAAAVEVIKKNFQTSTGPTEPEKTDPMMEKELTKPEKKEKEKIVKGMKKDKKGFKQRYGDDAESVMYATATKLAKEKK